MRSPLVLILAALVGVIAFACSGETETTPVGKIAFFVDHFGNRSINTSDADGTGLTSLTANLPWDSFPVWSPDSTTIAFYSDRGGDNDIYVVNADGSQFTNLTAGAAQDAFPVW